MSHEHSARGERAPKGDECSGVERPASDHPIGEGTDDRSGRDVRDKQGTNEQTTERGAAGALKASQGGGGEVANECRPSA
jgi:hypothetical protein